jgi:P-type Cu+ transporter
MNDHAYHGCCADPARDRHRQSEPHGHHHHALPTVDVHTVKDPVCGMDVDPHKTQHRHEHAGRTYYFCSAGCRTKFAADPDRYLGDTPPARPVSQNAIYTCPMHPEVRQV